MLEVSGLGRPNPTGALNGFGDDGSNLITTIGEDLLHGFLIIGGHVDDAGDERTPPLAVRGNPLQRRSAVVSAVVAALAADDDCLLRMPRLALSDAGELHRGINRF